MSQDIGLVFGVAGGGSISGKSGQKILNQIKNIVGNVNKRVPQLDLKADYHAVIEAHKQLQQLSNQIDAINTKHIKVDIVGAGADLGKIEEGKPLPVLSVKVDTSELDRVEGQLGNIRNLISTMPELAVGKDLESELSKAYKAAKGTYKEFLGKESDFKLLDTELDNKDVQEAVELHEKLLELAKGFTDSEGLIVKKTAFDDAANEKYEEFNRTYAKYVAKLKDGNKAVKAAEKANKDHTKEIMNGQVMLNKLYNSYNKFKNIKDYPKLVANYDELVAKIKGYDKDDNGNLLISAEEVKKLKAEINKFENACYEAGVQADTFGEAIEHKISDRLKYLIGQFAIDFVVQGLRRIYDNVVQIDAAMTELKKVTDETDEAYDKFLTNAGQRAKELGASLVEVVQITSDYARTGLSLEEASAMADAAIIYRNVGDGLKDADEATDHLISTMKAFGIEASNSMRIVDAFNEVSNNFAVTSSDIGAGLQRSSAAMAAAGNSMEETIALFTAGNTIIRDADVMGTSLRTISMRLRSTKSDLENLGEDTDGAAESVSSLRKELLALTGVDIQLDSSSYKNTYTILQELSKVWGNLDDLTQANVLEKLFGKRQANVGAAILENFNIAEESLETAMNSVGSAVKENEKYLESIQGHLDQLTASFQTLSSNVLDSELIKLGVDTLKFVMDLLNGIIEVFDLLGAKSVGVAIDIMLVATALDVSFGMKHVKMVVSGIKSIIATIIALKNASSSAAAASALTFLTDGATGASAAISKLIVALVPYISILPIIAGLLVAVGAGIKATFDATAENQLKDIEKAKSEYEGLKNEVDELGKSYEENKKRIEELNSISVRTTVEQEELDRLERENELLDAQIKYKEKLLAIEKRDIVDETQDAFYNTFGYGKKSVFGKEFYTKTSTYGSTQGYNNSAYLDSYKQIVDDIAKYESELNAEYSKDPTEQSRKRISELEKLKTEAESLEAEMLANLLQWRNDLAGETDEISVSIVDAINKVIYGVSAEGEMKNILLNDGFSDIIDFLVDHTEITSIDQLTARLAESFGVTFDASALAAFKSALEAAGYTLDDVRESADALEGKSPVDVDFSIPTEELESAREAVKNLSSECKTMADAFKEQNENGALSVDTILDVIDAGYAAALVVDQETGAVRLDAEAYKALAQAKIELQIIDLQTKKGELEQTLLLEQEKLAALETAKGYAVLAEAKKLSANVDLVTAQIAALDAQIAALNDIDLSKVTQGIYGIGDAASSAKSKLSKLQSGMENLLSQTISWLKQEYSDAQKAQENYYNSQIDALEEAKDAAKDRWDAEKEALEDAKDSYNDLIDAQIELLKRQKEADDYAKSKAEKEDAVADIENQLLAIENDDSIEAQKMRLELQEQLKEAKDELDELQSDREYELREQALQDEKDRYNDEIDAKLDAIEKQSEAEEKAYQDRIDRLHKYLDAVRDAERTEAEWRSLAYDWIENHEEALYQELIEWNRLYGDGRDSTVEQWFKEAEGWRAWGDTFEEARNNLARYLYELAEAVGGAAKTTANLLEDLLKQLADYERQLLDENDKEGAKMIESLQANLEKAVRNGMQFSEEMLKNMLSVFEDGVETSEKAILKTTNDTIGWLNVLQSEGDARFRYLWESFRNAMETMDRDQFTVLQGMVNNLEVVILKTQELERVLSKSADKGYEITVNKNGLNTGSVSEFSEGGVVDYTGPAAVHGSKSHPEVVFNADAASKLYNYVVNTPDLLKSAFAGITADSSMLRGASQINNSPSVGDININITGNADADTVNKLKQIASTLKDEVVKSLNESMNRRGVMRSPRMV